MAMAATSLEMASTHLSIPSTRRCRARPRHKRVDGATTIPWRQTSTFCMVGLSGDQSWMEALRMSVAIQSPTSPASTTVQALQVGLSLALIMHTIEFGLLTYVTLDPLLTVRPHLGRNTAGQLSASASIPTQMTISTSASKCLTIPINQWSNQSFQA